MMINSNKKA